MADDYRSATFNRPVTARLRLQLETGEVVSDPITAATGRNRMPDPTRVPSHEWPRTTPEGHTYEAPVTYRDLTARHMDAAQGLVESWAAEELPPEPTWEMVGIAHTVILDARRLLTDIRAGCPMLPLELDDRIAAFLASSEPGA